MANFIPTFYCRCLQFCGVFLFPTANYFTATNPEYLSKCKLRFIWSIILFIFFTIFGASTVLQIYFIYQQDLNRLEFFALICMSFRIVVFSQNSIMVASFWWKRYQVMRLLKSLQKSVNGIDTDISSRFFLGSIFWIFLTIFIANAGLLYVTIGFYNKFSLNWTDSGTFLSISIIPGYLLTIIVMIVDSVTAFHAGIVQFFVVGLVLFLRNLFDGILKEVKKLVDDPKRSESITVLRNQRARYIETTFLMRDCNSAFGLALDVLFIRDFITTIAVVGMLLRVPDECEEKDMIREAYNSVTRLYIYVYGSFGMFNLVVRLYVFLGCHKKSLKLCHILMKIIHVNDHRKIKHLAGVFRNQIQYEDGAVSINGFILVTREFVATFTGLLATYFILIYQTRDSQINMKDLARKVDVIEYGREIQGQLDLILALIRNSSVPAHNA